MGVISTIAKNLEKEVAPSFGKFVEEQPGLFSKLAEVTNRLPFSKMDSRQLNKTLMNKGVTSDEIADTLSGLSGTVTKPQVLERIGERGIKTEDVMLADRPNFVDAEGNLRKSIDYAQPEKTTGPTHYSTWVAPGAKEGSYREMFVTVPERKYTSKYFESEEEALKYADQNTNKNYELLSYDPNKEYNYFELPSTVRKDIDREGGHIEGDKYVLKGEDGPYKFELREKGWKDGHLGYEDIPNPLVRIRFNDRELPEGKKILFVEEIQGPQGDQMYQLKNNVGGLYDTKEEALLAAKKYGVSPSDVEKIIQGEQGKMPPSLQERIYDIGVKRILAYAKENGYDGVAWTPGKMQADRYSLAKRIDSLRITKFPSGTYHIGASKGNTPLLVEEGVSESDLPRYIGKELAGKAITQLGNKNTGQVLFEGLDLEIGGEGLKNLYDVRIPSLFKKYGKSEIGEIEIQSTPSLKEIDNIEGTDKLRNTIKVPYIPITPSTLSRYPIYTLPPLLALGLGAKEFGPDYFQGKQPARPRGAGI